MKATLTKAHDKRSGNSYDYLKLTFLHMTAKNIVRMALVVIGANIQNPATDKDNTTLTIRVN